MSFWLLGCRDTARKSSPHSWVERRSFLRPLRALRGVDRSVLRAAISLPEPISPQNTRRGSVIPQFYGVNAMAARNSARRPNTKRDEAESKLRASEDRYRLLFDKNPTAMWVYDAKNARVSRGEMALRSSIMDNSRAEFSVDEYSARFARRKT